MGTQVIRLGKKFSKANGQCCVNVMKVAEREIYYSTLCDL